ncbi:MAG TPA: gamma carbonic anhydrase family protein [Azoarcus sp.]|nr:gamma carbonic anhydrase family protein [Azoarcus sp.]
MPIHALGDRAPSFGAGCWLADSATVIGAVCAGRNVSFWYQVVVRSDNDVIRIGDDTNIQDGAILHCDFGIPLTIGKRVSLGHKAMLHGCTIGDSSLIGINAVILNNAVVGEGCIIGANSLIPENKVIPPRSLVVGSPGRIIRQVTDEEIERIHQNADHYIENIRLYTEGLRPLPPLPIQGA